MTTNVSRESTYIYIYIALGRFAYEKCQSFQPFNHFSVFVIFELWSTRHLRFFVSLFSYSFSNLLISYHCLYHAYYYYYGDNNNIAPAINVAGMMKNAVQTIGRISVLSVVMYQRTSRQKHEQLQPSPSSCPNSWRSSSKRYSRSMFLSETVGLVFY